MSFRIDPQLKQDSRGLTISRLANLAASAILEAFALYQARFQAVTRRAQTRFEQRDWRGAQRDAAERLDLYAEIVNPLVAELRELLDDRVEHKLVWASMKAVYSGLISERTDRELAETFYNSITRRVFATVGVDPDIEFVDTDFDMPITSQQPIYRKYGRAESLASLVHEILADLEFAVPFENADRDASLVADAIARRLKEIGALRIINRTEIVQSIFYRGTAAYLVGRMFSGVQTIPLVLALLNTPDGIIVDAVLLRENEVSILFSFARSYFHVDAARPSDLVLFLRGIMPRKRIAELYISIGYNKHGKTVLYRDILQHLALSGEQFDIAQGERGMVMIVFTMLDYDLVFKIIKDQFAYPKRTTHQEVRDKYRLVFKHDRAGRLVDAQEFEHLKFDRARFSESLLQELQAVAGRSIHITADHVVVAHCYIERRVTPLNIYIQEAGPEAAQAAVIEYGNAIKDMAATNIFPGDLWLKNFGVTRHGRVVFYDYDELTLLTDCRFRRMPPARTYEDELSAGPWFTVEEHDVFPEEFGNFLGFQGALREAFMRLHADLLDVGFWRGCQERLRAGEAISFYPYGSQRRLRQLPL